MCAGDIEAPTAIREIGPTEDALAVPALAELRPEFCERVLLAAIREQRAEGYRLIGSFEDAGEHAVGIVGFRLMHTLAWGRHIYIDDLSTLPEARTRGHAGRLLDWVFAEAHRLLCAQVHLDSGVHPSRSTAHRVYFNHGFRINAFHFAGPVDASRHSG